MVRICLLLLLCMGIFNISLFIIIIVGIAYFCSSSPSSPSVFFSVCQYHLHHHHKIIILLFLSYAWPGVECWSHWYRKDHDHLRQADPQHGQRVYPRLHCLLSQDQRQPNTGSHWWKTGQEVLVCFGLILSCAGSHSCWLLWNLTPISTINMFWNTRTVCIYIWVLFCQISFAWAQWITVIVSMLQVVLFRMFSLIFFLSFWFCSLRCFKFL